MSSLQQSLLDMSDDDFKKIVDDDIRLQAEPEVREALRSPAVIGRFHLQLQTTVVHVDGQVAANEADLAQLVSKHHKWKATSLRFKTNLEMTLLEVRHLYDQRGVDAFQSYAAQERNWALARAHALEEAIRNHRGHLDPDQADSADVELWATVDNTLSLELGEEI